MSVALSKSCELDVVVRLHHCELRRVIGPLKRGIRSASVGVQFLFVGDSLSVVGPVFCCQTRSVRHSKDRSGVC